MEFVGGKIRKNALRKLEVFISNPGRFCLIVIGSRGTGKHFAIEKAFEKVKNLEHDDLCLQGLSFLEANKVPNEEKLLNELLEEHQNKTLVVEDVEGLSSEQEKLLFEALSTTDGRFGITKKFKVRMVFTSSKESDLLREDGKYLTGIFWDRISQLIVEFPSYKKERENIIEDFHSTWKKMKFEKIEGYEHLSNMPKNSSIEKFLEDNSEKFEGGFRDLDKIACMYFHYRMLHYNENKKIMDDIEKLVVDSIKDDFFSKSQMQQSSGNDASIFRFEIGLTYQELLKKYKIQLRRWAVKEWGTVKKAEEKLGFKPGSMKNYADKSQKV